MMSGLKYLLLTLLATATFAVHAASEERLTFENADGSTVSFSTSGLIITYNIDGDIAQAVVMNDEISATLDLNKLKGMYFGEKDNGLIGDVNGDGEVNIADVNAVMAVILSGNAHDNNGQRADVNGDGEVNIADVNTVVDIILNS